MEHAAVIERLQRLQEKSTHHRSVCEQCGLETWCGESTPFDDELDAIVLELEIAERRQREKVEG